MTGPFSAVSHFKKLLVPAQMNDLSSLKYRPSPVDLSLLSQVEEATQQTKIINVHTIGNVPGHKLLPGIFYLKLFLGSRSPTFHFHTFSFIFIIHTW